MTEDKVSDSSNEDNSPVKYHWGKMDIESRMGLPAGKYTSANIFVSLLFGVIATMAIFGITYTLGYMKSAELFSISSAASFLVIFLLTTALCNLFVKWRKLTLQQKMLYVEVFPSGKNIEFTKDFARETLAHMRNLVDDSDNFLLLSRIKEVLSIIRFMGVTDDISKYLRNRVQEDDALIKSSYLPVKIIIWIIPLLGIAGTLAGTWSNIAGQHQGMAVEALKGGVSGITAASGDLLHILMLNVAKPLDNILIAFTASLVVFMLSVFLRAREEVFLNSCNDFCHANILRKIKISYGDRLEHIRLRAFLKNSVKALDQLWHELENDTEDVTLKRKESKEHIKAFFDNARKKIAAKRRKTLLFSLIMLTVIASTIMLSINVKDSGRIRKMVEHDIDVAFESEDVSRIESLLDDIENSYTFVFTSGEIEAKRLVLEKLKIDIAHQKEIFKKNFDALEKIRKGGFNEESSTIEKMLQDASLNMKHVSVAKQADFIDLKRLWEEKKIGVTVEAKQEMTRILKALTDEFNRIEANSRSSSNQGKDTESASGKSAKVDSSNQSGLPAKSGESSGNSDSGTSGSDEGKSVISLFNLMDGGKAINRIESLIVAATQITNVSQAMKDSVENFRARLELIKVAWAKRRNVIAEFDKVASLKQYIDTLESFKGKFPNDGINAGISSICSMYPFYYDLLSYPSDMKEKTLFWSEIAERIKAFDQNFAVNKVDVVNEIKKIQMIHAFTNLWECIVNKPNQKIETWYFMGHPTQTFVDGVKSYAGGAYIPLMDDVQPAFPEKFVINVHVQELKKASHCDYVNKMVERILSDPSLETMLKEMRYLVKQRFSPILKLDLLRYFAKPLVTIAGRENSGDFAALADLLEKSSLKHHWLCTSNQKYEIESKKADALVNEIIMKSKKIHEYMVKLKIEKIALQRLPRWVGYADLEDSEKFHLNTSSEPNEIWVVRSTEHNVSGNPEANFSGNPEANLSGNPEANLSGNPEDNISGSPEGNLSENSQANLSGNPEDNISGKAQQSIAANSKKSFTANAEQRVAQNSQKGVTAKAGQAIVHSLPMIMVAREKLHGGVLTYAEHGKLFPGEPLFAPSDGQTTWILLQELVNKLEIKGNYISDEWPLVWPVNVRAVNSKK
ncbi:membrane hypothetical protein [Desulfamplus magnetovallimortis]|uniref:MotA/TolQ/ExbB proton channel domain-containing protein n=1 Tax=Desulfamplus magnetovallimortis TaxID=1246637 RepID=A0A1W1HCA7_9BACT|nr:hypothetical protein [Desulfamplus magnetovallimortis]SLM30032.1 membrane hypothetical protein [Desulfamplus magnetovallimortis]